ncbi:MAG: hypothetical protein WC344_03485 [Bacilli bacterium]|jgi:predicted DNA-binding protein YlxM (UPF0122 family)
MKDHLSEINMYSELLDFYGRLLTDAQLQIMSDYYLYDLSLAEISENRKITRSAALDAIKQASKKLDSFEAKLGLVHAFKECKQNSEGPALTALEELEGKIKNGL